MKSSRTVSPEVQHAETGHFWHGMGNADFLRVIDFAGFQVPEDGLVLTPPFGGEFTVWPDGQYSFVCPASGDSGQSMVATHYSYIVEDIDGSTSLGTFALGEQAPEETMPDFQGWSLDDILALEDVVGLSQHVGASGEVLSDFETGMHVSEGFDLSLGTAEFQVDVLEHAIKASYES